MSRTDKTDPFRVKLWSGSLARQAVHDHSDGYCDLPATMAEDLATTVRGRCYWEFRFTGIFVCACEMCSSSAAGRRARRRSRQHAKATLDAVRHAWNSGDHDPADAWLPSPFDVRW